MKDEDLILNLIRNDDRRMNVLRAVRSLGLNDWLIGAGFVRNIVWDHLHNYTEQTPPTDIDVAYFDSAITDKEQEFRYEEQMKEIIDADWDITNQARIGKINNQGRDYVSSEDAISHWPETATAVGVRLNADNELELVSPHGIDDLMSLKVIMTPDFGSGRDYFLKRFEKKGWLEKWPKLILIKIKKQ
jgi:uncharacterized protein